MEKRNNRDSEIFPFTSNRGRCSYAPRFISHFKGTAAGGTPILPTIECGVIRLNGAISCNGSIGVQQDGHLKAGNPFSIVYDKILPGGTGVKIRCCKPPLRKRMRAKCCVLDCTTETQNLFLNIREIDACLTRKVTDWTLPFEVGHICRCMETCCQKLNAIAKIINDHENAPVNAAVVNIGAEYYLDIEARDEKADFEILGTEGFGDWKEIVPFTTQHFDAKSVDAMLCQNILTECDPNECFQAVEVYWMADIPFREAQMMGSNPTEANEMFHQRIEFALITFQDDAGTPGVNLAFNALKTILLGTSEYDKKLCDTSCPEDHVLGYCIARTDAGDVAALTAVRTAYAAPVFLTLDRLKYEGGKSYYTVTYVNPAGAPTAIGTDVVSLGICDGQNGSCTPSSPCPTVASSCCGCVDPCAGVAVTGVTASPAAGTINAPISLSAASTGTAPILFQWTVTGPSGAVAVTGGSTSLASFTPTVAGSYTAKAIGQNCGGTKTAEATATIVVA
jgi:hypothetical protein